MDEAQPPRRLEDPLSARLPISLLLGLYGCAVPAFDGVAPQGSVADSAVDTQADPEPAVEVAVHPSLNFPDSHEEVYGDEPAPFFVHLGAPDGDGSTSASFLWRTDTETLATEVQIGVAQDYPKETWTVEGTSFLFNGSVEGDGDERMHEVSLEGRLLPGTTYRYRVGGEGSWSPTYDFTTQRALGSGGSLRIALVGDSRGGYDTWGHLLRQIDAAEPDLILFSGDLVTSGSNMSDWDGWFENSGDVLARRLLLPAHGNHEFLAPEYFAQFDLPGNEEWFAWQGADLLVVALNDSVMDPAQMGEQAQWAREILAASEARWRIAIHHKAMYSTCTSHGSAMESRDSWADILEDGGVQLVVAGHNHIYERSIPILHDQPSEAGVGTVYVVTGGAGASLYTRWEPEWFGVVADPIEHYVILDLSDDKAEGTAWDLSGNVVDTFTLLP